MYPCFRATRHISRLCKCYFLNFCTIAERITFLFTCLFFVFILFLIWPKELDFSFISFRAKKLLVSIHQIKSNAKINCLFFCQTRRVVTILLIKATSNIVLWRFHTKWFEEFSTLNSSHTESPTDVLTSFFNWG